MANILINDSNTAIGGTFPCFLMPVPSPVNGEGCGRKSSGRKNFFQNTQMRNHHQSIPDWSRPGLPTTASGVAQQGTCGNCATAEHSKNKRRKRGGRRVKRQEVWKGKTLTRKGEYLKYRNNDWKGKRAGRLDGTKECRHTVPTGNKVERE